MMVVKLSRYMRLKIFSNIYYHIWCLTESKNKQPLLLSTDQKRIGVNSEISSLEGGN